jgi:hypothetical protein
LQIGKIGLHARNPRHQRAALGWRIGAEDQETPVVAADLARISKTALKLCVLSARRIRKAAGTLGVLAVERRPLILQRHATRCLREGVRAEGERGYDEEREMRRAREASVNPHPVSLLRAALASARKKDARGRLASVIGIGQVNLSLSSTSSAASKIRLTPHMRSVDGTIPRRGYTLRASKAIVKP